MIWVWVDCPDVAISSAAVLHLGDKLKPESKRLIRLVNNIIRWLLVLEL